MVRTRAQFLIRITVFMLFLGLVVPGISWAQFGGTARDYYDDAEQVAVAWHSDAALLYLLGSGEDLYLAGELLLWTYFFESASDDSILMVLVSLGFPVLSQEIGDTISILEPLPDNWIDSDDAVAVAESHGGSEFRSVTGSDLMVAVAGRGFYVPEIERPVWFFSYLDTTVLGRNLYVYVDAVTGAFIDSLWLGIEDQLGQGGGLPKVFTLSENYPNPFNPHTTLEYGVPPGAAKEVEVEVFDLRGRRLKTLFSGTREPGTYRVHWDGRDDNGRQLGSGIYLARLRSADQTVMRKMVLLR